MKHQGFNYLGIIDDVVERFPWQFDVTDRRLEHSLVIQLLDGRPILLNDGYLCNHHLAQAAILERRSLLWCLIDAGFVRVLARGGDRFGIHEMPERMQEQVASFKTLVNSQTKGVPDWRIFRARLEELDAILRLRGHLISWPSFDAGSGLLVLAQRLKEQNSTPWSLGLGFKVRRNAFSSFLERFIERMSTNTAGARTAWEQLAEQYAANPDYTSRPEVFARGLMNLANEMYHYNFGVMLASEHAEPVSVETQTSPAFDDLLIKDNVVVADLPGLPRLRIPRSILGVPPAKLVQVLESDNSVSEARSRWIELKSWQEAQQNVDSSERLRLNDAAIEYSRRLSAFLGHDVKHQTGENLFEYVVDNMLAPITSTVGTAVGGYIGNTAGEPYIGGMAGFLTGFVISRLQKRGMDVVTRKFRIELFEKAVLPPRLVQESQRAVAKIKYRRVPSSLLIDRKLALSISAKMRKFVV